MALKPFTPPSPKMAPPSEVRARERILYVEDEDVNWEVTMLNLKDRYELVRAATSEQAFLALRGEPFNLILMDIQLSGSDLSGIEITQILKGRYKGEAPGYTRGVKIWDIPIIFVTAYKARYSKEDLREAGGDDLITKPVDFTGLNLAISRVIARSVSGRVLAQTNVR